MILHPIIPGVSVTFSMGSCQWCLRLQGQKAPLDAKQMAVKGLTGGKLLVTSFNV